MSDKIRKYVLPNLPYLFVFWFFSKVGTAYRMAAGADFGTKLVGMMKTFPTAFENYLPGLGGLDLLVGLTGAVGMYLLVQSKIRKGKKFRREEEYGSARWGTAKDIKPFVDPVFKNNVILTGTEFLTLNTRPKIPANARNLNACVIGSSGSGKTRFWLTPQLLQAHSSYVQKAAPSNNAGVSCNDRATGSGCSTLSTLPNPCITIHWPTSRRKVTC